MITKISTQRHYVYRIINTINEKEYTGVHSTYDMNDGYMGSGTALRLAFRKYGKKNFKKIIIQEFKTRKEAFQKEKELVSSQYIKHKNVYNLAQGGSGWSHESKLFIPHKYTSPCFKNDINPQIRFYVDSDELMKFKETIKVDMNASLRDILVFRKQAKNLFVEDIDKSCIMVTNEWNDSRFYGFASNLYAFWMKMGFDSFIRTEVLKTT